MTATLTGRSPLQSAISLGTVFESIATGSLITSAAFNIPALSGSSSYPDLADLVLLLGGSLTLGSGTPFIQAAVIIADDGSDFETPAVTNSQLYPYWGGVTQQLTPSQAYSSGGVIKVPGIIIPPGLTSGSFAKLIANWQGGATTPATVTASLYPSGGSVG